MDTLSFHTATLDLAATGITLILRSAGDNGNVVFRAAFGNDFPKGAERIVDESEDDLIITWDRKLIVTIAHRGVDDGHIYDIRWEVKNNSLSSLCDDISLENNSWYGGAQIARQLWPVDKWRRGLSAFVTGDAFEDQYGGVQERYWLCSSGVAVYVEEDVPLFVAINSKGDNHLKFVSKWKRPYRNCSGSDLTLAYSIFQGTDVKHVHKMASAAVFAKPSATPNDKLFRYPIWSTWAQYKKKINQDLVLEFAREIKDRGFPASQIEIDDDWTPYYGDMTFDVKKFPDPKSMIAEIHSQGSLVTLWVHPFASLLSQASRKPYWITRGGLSGISIWWNGICKCLDVTNPDAVAWFKDNLETLKQEYGVDSFKFDAGEMNWLPSRARSLEPLSNPSAYTTKYARLAADVDRELRIQEVRVGFRTQDLPVLVRMMDKDSNWGDYKGLRSLIPHALTFSILGYPFILPDMIGGNAYRGTGWPDRELYIRWLQATTFLPVLQFSVPPWHYDEEVVDIARRMVALHEAYAEMIISLARDAMVTGDPIIRPLWWVAPNDEVAQCIDSEFLVGDDILVAPILYKDARSRDVYLPPGYWKDELRGDVKPGEAWYLDYAADLQELPYFKRLSDSDAAAVDDVTVASLNTGTTETSPSEVKVDSVESSTLENDRDDRQEAYL